MPRRGWSSLPTPSGWYEVVRGPRPQSVQWPRRQQWYSSNQWSGQWPAVSESRRTPIRRRWHRNNVPRLNPDEAKAAARTRVDRLETALAALGETESAEARGLHAALKEAQRAAQERPLAAQVEECQAFIKRSQARLARLEQEQVREQKELDAALARMARFREEMTRAVPVVPPPAESNATQPARVPDLVAEIERLRSRVAEMESRKRHGRSAPGLCPDLIGGPDLSLQHWGASHDDHVGRGKGAIMETLISRGSTLAANSNRFSPLA